MLGAKSVYKFFLNSPQVFSSCFEGLEFGKDLSVFHKIVKTDGLNASEVLKITVSVIKELL